MPIEPLTVQESEAGQKLFQFLQRRFEKNISSSDIHKWIRSGQVRINGKRVKAFDRVTKNDIIRIPPFEICMTDTKEENFPTAEEYFKIIHEDNELLIIDKPAGLAVQGGSGQIISVTDYLKIIYKNTIFMPAIAHRLDKEASGLLMIGKSYTMLSELQRAFAQKNEKKKLKKIYLTWVKGEIHETGKQLWQDTLEQQNIKGFEKMTSSAQGKEAELIAEVLTIRKGYSLLQIELLTGRKHQIRTQCALRGYPIVGDTKYEGEFYKNLLLHSHQIEWENTIYTSFPTWEDNFKISRT